MKIWLACTFQSVAHLKKNNDHTRTFTTFYCFMSMRPSCHTHYSGFLDDSRHRYFTPAAVQSRFDPLQLLDLPRIQVCAKNTSEEGGEASRIIHPRPRMFTKARCAKRKMKKKMNSFTAFSKMPGPRKHPVKKLPRAKLYYLDFRTMKAVFLCILILILHYVSYSGCFKNI